MAAAVEAEGRRGTMKVPFATSHSNIKHPQDGNCPRQKGWLGVGGGEREEEGESDGVMENLFTGLRGARHAADGCFDRDNEG